MTSTEEFIFTWKIVNFSRYPWQSAKDYIPSPRIHVKNFFNTAWFLCVQPNPEGSFSCSLLREPPSFDHGPEAVTVYVEISINSFTETGIFTFEKSRICTLILNELAFKTQDCVVVCRMCLLTPKSAGDGSDLLTFLEYPRYLPPDFCFSEMWEELISSVRRNSQGSREIFSPYPRSCTGLTVVCFERRTVSCPLLKINHLADEENLYLPVISLSYIPDLLLTLKKTVQGEVEDIEMRLCFIGDLNLTVQLVCEAEILWNEVRACSVVKNCYFYKQRVITNICTLKKFLQLPKGKRFENARLKLKFSIFYGCYSTFIEHTEEVDYYTDEISEQIAISSTADFLGDVFLHMNNEATPVHEINFHLIYPEPNTRLEGAIEERKTSDLDSVTVGNVLCCLCTGNVDVMQLYRAMCFLYTAADKHQMTQLKAVCRKILKINLVVETISCVLLLADAYRDAELQDSAASFISIHKEAVFQSHGWKSLESSNPKIGLEILEKVCNKFSPMPPLS